MRTNMHMRTHEHCTALCYCGLAWHGNSTGTAVFACAACRGSTGMQKEEDACDDGRKQTRGEERKQEEHPPPEQRDLSVLFFQQQDQLTVSPSFRSFLKKPGAPNIPIQAIGLSLYEQLSDSDVVEEPGTKVTRTQWLDLSSLEMNNLIGKNVLIVDEVDDTRTTLEYAVKELEKDVETARKQQGRTEQTKFSIFVLHNKDKPKKGRLPDDMINDNRYLAAVTVPDCWICYPWEATDIDEHDRLAAEHSVQ
ncbi:hypoxanthine-guanine phosphoribosyltransferase [Exophiala dermatitidis]|nr:hypoxanthine-guanine phosphoribosyltransferase, variant 2 [Exophiala dermatitidis]KAJ4610686.1 hypoxanthine-guanine phosphoribosyltransferase [Exophiala dermatitidis]KAJ4689758.1 hypoxanthine-guanine phosphoribosyltransferase, variant 2 [Exophiala dermatitidis]